MVKHLFIQKEIQHLIDNGADLNAKTRTGETPLFYNIVEDNFEIVRLLLKNGANVNAKNKKGESVLFQTKNPRMIRLLLEHGADVTLKNHNGKTPFEIDYDDQQQYSDEQRISKLTQQYTHFLRNKQTNQQFSKIQEIRKKYPYGSLPEQGSGGGGGYNE